jgi:glutathione S-transferase
MITLYTFPKAFGLRNVSPFCLKAEMALTHLNTPFRLTEVSDPRKSPKGKLPFVDFNGRLVSDSEIIFDHLDMLTQGNLYKGLSSREMAQGWAYARLAEEHLYWLMVASRWLDDAWWPHIESGFFGDLPFPVRVIVPRLARRQVRQTFLLQGLGLHSFEEQQTFARKDLGAINDLVCDRRFLMGDRLCAFDFTVGAMLAGIIDNKPDTWLTEIAREFESLSDYAERVQAEVGVWGREPVAK